MSSPEHDQPADDEIAMRCLRRGWRRRRLGHEVFVFDEKAEYLVRLDDSVASRLPGPDAPPGASLLRVTAVLFVVPH